MVSHAHEVVIGRWVRRRKPSSDVLIYLVPCDRVSVLTIQTMEVARHRHCISLTSGQTTVQCNVSNWRDGLRTLHSLSHGHRNLLLYQVI